MSHFVCDGEKVELVPSAHTFTLRRKDVSASTLSQALIGSHVDILASDNEMGVVVVTCPEGRAPLDRALAAAGLGGRVDVAPSYVQMGGTEDDSWSPTRRVIARFPKDFNRAAIDAILARHNVEILSEIDDMPNGYMLLVHSGDPVEIARALVEEDNVPDAEPDFIRRFWEQAQAS